MARFDRLARIYDRVVPFETRDALLRHLGLDRHHLVLDIGGGTGRVGSFLAPHCRRCVVLDPSGGMLDRARRLRRPVDLVRGEGGRLPIRDRSVDRVLLVDALHHVGDWEATLREVRRVLRLSGLVLVAEFRTDRWWVRWGITGLERLFLFRSRFPRPESWRRRFEAVGFDVQVRPASWKDLHYVLTPTGSETAPAPPGS